MCYSAQARKAFESIASERETGTSRTKSTKQEEKLPRNGDQSCRGRSFSARVDEYTL